MKYAIVKVQGADNRAEVTERATGQVIAAGSMQACVAAARLLDIDFEFEGYKSCVRFEDTP